MTILNYIYITETEKIPIDFDLKLFQQKRGEHKNTGSKETGYKPFSGDLLPMLYSILHVIIPTHM